MTVAELIAKLAEFPADMQVWILGDEGHDNSPVGAASLHQQPTEPTEDDPDDWDWTDVVLLT
jgi:hypothetical protein